MQRLQKKVQATRNAMTNVLLCEMKIKKSLILQLTIVMVIRYILEFYIFINDGL